MNKPQIRSSQLITAYGPGALVDLPNDAVIIGGLDYWNYNKQAIRPTIDERRLKQKLRALFNQDDVVLCKPPAAVEEKGFTPDITVFRFPQWYIVQNQVVTPRGHRARRLVPAKDIEKGRFRDHDGSHPVVPVRFVRACRRGHIGDIAWYDFVHGGDHGCRRELWIEERGTSGDLENVWVRCGCGAERSMSVAANWNTHALGSCDGARPWLGSGTREPCGEPNRLLIRSASNAYFPQLLSVISIPESEEGVRPAVRALWEKYFQAVHTLDELKVFLRIPEVKQHLKPYSEEAVFEAINRIREHAEEEEPPVKEVEFDALSRSEDELGINIPNGRFYARNFPRDRWDKPCMKHIERVVLVHRLREVIALVGFTRFEAGGPDIQGELDFAVEPARLDENADFFPAIENIGEGIFLRINSEAVEQWLKVPAVRQRDAELQAGFQAWQTDHPGSRRQYPGLPYFMLHSLSHLLLISIAVECGYPASSLKERVYAMPGKYGILLYTGSSDAEGTLGGLVDEGRRIAHHVRRALELGRLCSNDPVCAFHKPQVQDHLPLLGSACHGCLLISETSCEQRNDFLDRALVVSTIERLGAEFFPDERMHKED